MARILVTGASGLVGTALCPKLAAAGAEVVRLVRREARGPDESRWDPLGGDVDEGLVAGAAAIVHLAGENVGDGRWTEERKRRLVESRVRGAALLARVAARVDPRPAAFVSASAIGFYGDRGDVWLDEQSPPGSGFLADLCKAWEAATEPAREAGIRTARLRVGVVLARGGGALAKILPVFRWGGGGRLGSGRQYMSWVSLEDAARAFAFACDDARVAGPVNVTSPHPVTNEELTRALAREVGRPALVPVPAFALRVALGEMADETVLASQRCRPAKLAALGFEFSHPHLQGALAAALAGPP